MSRDVIIACLARSSRMADFFHFWVNHNLKMSFECDVTKHWDLEDLCYSIFDYLFLGAKTKNLLSTTVLVIQTEIKLIRLQRTPYLESVQNCFIAPFHGHRRLNVVLSQLVLLRSATHCSLHYYVQVCNFQPTNTLLGSTVSSGVHFWNSISTRFLLAL